MVEDNNEKIIYGFHRDGLNASPSDAITYLCDAAGMNPAYKDDDGNIHLNSWKNTFIIDRFINKGDIWLKCEMDNDNLYDYSMSVYISSYKVDETYRKINFSFDVDAYQISHFISVMIFKTLDILSYA